MSLALTARHSFPDDPDIETAADFLDDVSGKQYGEKALRSYLLVKRKLTKEQVDQAFKLHRRRMNARSQTRSSEGAKINREWSNSAEEAKSKQLEEVTSSNSSITDGPEIKIEVETQSTPKNSISMVKQEETSKTLIKNFLDSEKTYCDVLHCLWSDYYTTLAGLSLDRKLQMSHSECREMFKNIPTFCKFHSTLCKDLKGGAEIGRLFVRLFHFFKGYLDWMKNLSFIIKKLGEHNGDKKLQNYLFQIRKNSKFKQCDLIQLLMVPLDHILVYDEFLNNLVELTDKSKPSYPYLVKAARRIGRVASYVRKYRYLINNLHEVYKVQCFLKTGINIFADKRRLIRRGIMMLLRPTSWRVKNKERIFFLFNDMLLWTNKKGDFKDVIAVNSCKVLPWLGTNNSHRKLLIEAEEDTGLKVLRLECRTYKTRDEWFSIFESTIANSNKIEKIIDLPSVLKYEDSEEEEVVEQSSIPKEATKHEMNVKGAAKYWKKSTLLSGIPEEKWEAEDLVFDYEHSQNFPTRELEDFGPFDDTSSVISESELQFFRENSRYRVIRNGSTADLMSPFQSTSQISAEEKVPNFRQKNSDLKSPYAIERAQSARMLTGARSLKTGKDSSFSRSKSMREFTIRRSKGCQANVSNTSSRKHSERSISLDKFWD